MHFLTAHTSPLPLDEEQDCRLTGAFELSTRRSEFEFVTREFELLTRGFEFVTRRF